MPTALKSLLREIKSLEPLPQVAMKVIEIGNGDDVVPRDLVAVIQTDAGITAKVLKLCNSAFYGFRREIATLQEAGNLLGVNTLVNLVLTSCASKYFRDYGTASMQSAVRLWENSVTNALSACLLARMHGQVDKNRAYTSGLLQNVGLLVLERFTESGPDIEAAVRSGVPRLAAEEAELGMHHAEIGARLAETWGLPELLVDCIRHHHTPELAQVDPLLTSIGHLGEVVTSAFVMGEGLEGIAYGLNDSALGLAGLNRTDFEALEGALTTELAKAREFVEA
jgi:HD-like signal output (HDOD) protein